MRSVWDQMSNDYDSERERDRVYSNCIVATVGEISRMKGEPFLELGCGTGLVTRADFSKNGVKTRVGVDFSLESLKKLKQADIPDLHLVCADICKLPFKDSTFPSIVCTNTLQHFQPIERQGALSEMQRVCKFGGSVLTTVHNYSDWKKRKGWAKVSYSYKGRELYTFRFSPEDLSQELLSCFSVKKIIGIGYPVSRRYIFPFWGGIELLIKHTSLGKRKGHMLLAVGIKP